MDKLYNPLIIFLIHLRRLDGSDLQKHLFGASLSKNQLSRKREEKVKEM
jgi:hypothetical protein